VPVLLTGVGIFDQKSMKTNTLEILECGRQTVSQDSVCAGHLFPFELELFGVHLELCAVCRNEKITLKDLVGPARQLCDIVTQLAIEHQRLYGKPVTCSAGCMACCKYMVTVSPAEVIAINDTINNLPRQSRLALLRSMTMAGRKILSAFPSIVKSCDLGHTQSSSRLVELSRWYAAISVTCPWIENKMCSLYSDRPLVCREFLVTSASANCNPNSSKKKTIIDLPIKMAEVLMEVCAKLTGTKPQAMFLPLVPAWCDEFSDLQSQWFDTRQTAELLIETMIEHQQRQTASATGSCQNSRSD
jgi:Fe-S-cluster containining protein